MSVITAANIVSLTDKLAALWIAALGTDGSGYGLGTSGASARALGKATDLEALIIAFGDADKIVPLLPGFKSLADGVDAYSAMKAVLDPAFQALNGACRGAGLTNVASLDQFASYYNTGTGAPWNCLFAPDFAEAYKAWRGAYPTAVNTYFEVLQGATYANGLRKLIVGTGQTAGQDIDSATYAGGYGQINVASITGSGVVTVTGTWRKTDGTTETGAGTATASGTGVVVLTPPTANDLLLTVTSIAAAAGISAGTIYAEAKRPSARSNPPT